MKIEIVEDAETPTLRLALCLELLIRESGIGSGRLALTDATDGLTELSITSARDQTKDGARPELCLD